MKRLSATWLFSVLFCFSFGLLLSSCDKKKSEKTEPTPDVKINAAFEMNPPIAEKVFVQKIAGDSNNVLFFAQFSRTEIKENFLAIDNDGEKVVLRDDGKGDDKTANDGVFTVRVKTDVREFEKVLQEQAKQQSGETSQRTFINRAMVVTPIESSVENPVKALELFRRGDRIIIDRFGIFPVPFTLGEHSLVVRDLHVVEDSTRTWNSCNQTGNINGPWTFNTLMRQLASQDPAHIANDIQLSDFVENWLNTWLNNQTINGELVEKRATMQNIITTWKSRSQTLSPPRVPIGKLDMRAAPLKLLAIVNRFDLRGNSGYGKSNAGEGRFVFCFMDGCRPAQFTVIFEYGVPKSLCAERKAYAQQWYNLKNLQFSNPQYNKELEAITDQFTKCGTSPSKPNQSSLNQLRTNEIRLARPWELREFTISSNSHQLQEVTVKQEPAVKFNGAVAANTLPNVQTFVNYVNSNAGAIASNSYTIPLLLPGNIPFLGGKAHTFSPSHIWNGRPTAMITNDEARHIVSLNTCSACHGGETRTSFTHISPAAFNSVAALSGFLTGITVSDPAGRPVGAPTQRTFNDIQRRADDLEKFVNIKCVSIFGLQEKLVFRPIKMTH